jgi:ribosomal protein S18 acetylase RimI-like enzyme
MDAISPADARDVAIRPAAPDDFAGVCDLFRVLDEIHVRARPDLFFDVPGDARPRSYYDAILADPDQTILVAEPQAEIVSGQLTGLVHVLLKVKANLDVPGVHPRTYGLINNLSVAPALRSRGIGRLLMEAGAAWAFERGATELEIQVHEFNQRARALYERMGFVTSVRTMRLVPGQSPDEIRGVLAGADQPDRR